MGAEPSRRRDEARKLERAFYERPTLKVARELIGMHLVRRHGRGVMVGRIVETEAYLGPRDLAAHTAGGRRTARTEVIYGAPGHAYVYFIYGVWHCLNLVTREVGTPHVVLVRALEPVSGIKDTTHGPGLLCRALRIDRTLKGTDLCSDTLWLERPAEPRPASLSPA